MNRTLKSAFFLLLLCIGNTYSTNKILQTEERVIPNAFGDSGNCRSIVRLITSCEQEDYYFSKVKQFILDKNYIYATRHLEILILSVIEGTLPYSEEKFETYKSAFLSLAAHCNEPAIVFSATLFESELYLTAAKIIEFISEKQNNTKGAEDYAILLIEESRKALSDDLLYSMLEIWSDFHKSKGTLNLGIAYVQHILRDLVCTPNKQLFLSSIIIHELEIYFHNIETLGAPFVIEQCKEVIDLAIDHAFKNISTYAHSHEKEILYDMSLLLVSSLRDVAWQNERNKDNGQKGYRDADAEEYETAFKNGISELVKLSQNKLAEGIVEMAQKTANLIEKTFGAEQASRFLLDVQTKLAVQGFAKIYDPLTPVA